MMLHLNERDHNREGGLTCLLPARVCERLERSVLIAGLHEKHEKKKRSFFFFLKQQTKKVEKGKQHVSCTVV